MLFNDVVKHIVEELQNFNVLAIILFGSYARFSKGNDIDLIVIVKDIPKDIKDNLEKKLSIDLTRRYRYRKVFDIHILTLDSFLENLKPPSFISGIFLGYEVIYDKINIKNIVECMRERLRRLGIKYTFIDKYGVWTIP